MREDTSLSLKLKENIDYKIENVKNVDTYVRLKSVREISDENTHIYIQLCYDFNHFSSYIN